ncbi:restriction endonuclease subunit S [Tepidibacter hydrothermalis]|uniref:Restriction endonuclease subunit S n=1 Tax=Tepidibacter hydrothermalis TaxID=3036126 RepID=A0ABY8EDM7_9FIRM|nr:restriction endonuclease subunit S [Tepidibacter hydrothermalis]WFD10876.1 restriction endonuclease subunit S [Tepidibacter hydrothermalis]
MSLKYYKLSEICDIEKGKTGISKAKEGQYPLIATAAEFKSSDKYDFDGRAVCIPLVSSTGHGHASINRLHYYDGKFALGTILAKVTSKDENVVDTKYLYIYLSFFKDEVLVPLMKGSANVSLTVTALKKLEIPIPSIEVQRKIKDLYESVNPLSALVNVEHNNQFENIPRLREKILDLAVRGLLVPQDPNDEPAFILVENIEKEKKRLIKEKIIKKSKPLLPIKEGEIPFELPDGWEWVRLEQIVELDDNSIRRGPFGSAITKGMFIPKSEDAIKIYEQKNAIRKNAKIGNYYISKEHFNKLKRFEVSEGDIIISCAGTIGETYLLPKGIEKGIINQALLKLRINNDIMLNEYFLDLFKSLTKVKINNDSKGSAIKNLGSVKYLKEEIVF